MSPSSCTLFEFGTAKGMQCCREFYEMKAWQEVGREDLPVFDLVGVAEAEEWGPDRAHVLCV